MKDFVHLGGNLLVDVETGTDEDELRAELEGTTG